MNELHSFFIRLFHSNQAPGISPPSTTTDYPYNAFTYRDIKPGGQSSGSSLHSILIRRASCHFLEQAAQVVRVLESHFISNLTDRLVRLQQTVFHLVDYGKMNVFDSRLAGLLLYKVSEIIGRKMKLVGTPGNGRQSQFFRLN